MNYLAVPARAPICRACGIEFHPLASHHELCRACFRWSRIGSHIAAISRLLRSAT